MAVMTRKKRIQACSLKWDEWKDAGHSPKTREQALKIISAELKAAGCYTTFETLKNQAKSIVRKDGSEEIDSNLSFIVWDLTQNNGSAINYNRDYNFLSGLLLQARNALLTETRARVTVKYGTVTVPTRVYIKGVGTAQRIDKLTPSQLGMLCNQFIDEAKAKVKRWQFMGANVMEIRQFLRKLNKEVLALYKVPAIPTKKPAYETVPPKTASAASGIAVI